MNRRCFPPVAALLLCASPGTAAPDDALAEKRACIAAHARAQRARVSGEIQSAAASLRFCARPDCPQLLREECAEWLTALEARRPTVVFGAKEVSGRTLTDVAVMSGSAVLTRRLGGDPVALDPGVHELRFLAADGREQRLRLSVASGTVPQTVEVTFPPAPVVRAEASTTTATPPKDDGLPHATWIAGSVGAGALVTAGYFGVTGLSLQRDMENNCAPRCPPEDVDRMQRRYVVADVALALSVAAFATALWFALDASPDQKNGASTHASR